jgi:hypothetical protein
VLFESTLSIPAVLQVGQQGSTMQTPTTSTSLQELFMHEENFHEHTEPSAGHCMLVWPYDI